MQLRLKRTRIHPGAGQLTDNFAVFCFFGEHSYSFYTILSFALDAKLVNIKPVKICYKCREKSVCTDVLILVTCCWQWLCRMSGDESGELGQQPWTALVFKSLYNLLSIQLTLNALSLVYMQLRSTLCLKTCLCMYLKERFATVVCNLYLNLYLFCHFFHLVILPIIFCQQSFFLHKVHTVFVSATHPL